MVLSIYKVEQDHNKEQTKMGSIIAIIIGSGITAGFITLGIGAYFLPAIVAYAKNTKNYGDVAKLNAIAGWTVIGWFGCLIWAMSAQKQVEELVEGKKFGALKNDINRANLISDWEALKFNVMNHTVPNYVKLKKGFHGGYTVIFMVVMELALAAGTN